MSTEMSPFAILGVDEGVSYEEVRSAFRLRALECHPDKIAKRNSSHQDQKMSNVDEVNATKEFQRVLKAFEILKKQLDSSERMDLVAQCRQDHLKGEGNVNRLKLSDVQHLDLDLYCLTCRCGYEIPIILDEVTQVEEFLIVDCDGCSAVYRISL